MSTITKKELTERIAESTQAKRFLIKATIQNFLDEVIVKLAKGNRLEFRDFGVFETKTRAAKTAQNPKTMERIQASAKWTVKFKMGRLMKEKLAAEVITTR